MGKRTKRFEQRESFIITFDGWEANDLRIEADRRRICGLPPTYTLLEAIRPRRGKLLHYDQYVHPEGYESVSFASMGFYE